VKRRGFTLIELMVVIAIIIILAAIAIPNYINMSKRANASRAISDAAVLATALEVYKTDTGAYPVSGHLEYLVSYTDLNNNTGSAISQATLNQITAAENAAPTYTKDAPAGGWTLVIVTKSSQTVTRTSEASIATVTG